MTAVSITALCVAGVLAYAAVGAVLAALAEAADLGHELGLLPATMAIAWPILIPVLAGLAVAYVPCRLGLAIYRAVLARLTRPRQPTVPRAKVLSARDKETP